MNRNHFQPYRDRQGAAEARSAGCSLTVAVRIALGVLLFSASAVCGVEIIHDFRSDTFDSKRFRYEGPNASQFIKPEAQGLHWLFSEGKTPGKPVGVYWNSRVSGDFVVMVRYEIQKVLAPEKGSGVGVEPYLMLDGPSKDGITLSRVESPEGIPRIK